MSDKEFSLYAEEEKIISRANELISLKEVYSVKKLHEEYKDIRPVHIGHPAESAEALAVGNEDFGQGGERDQCIRRGREE